MLWQLEQTNKKEESPYKREIICARCQRISVAEDLIYLPLSRTHAHTLTHHSMARAYPANPGLQLGSGGQAYQGEPWVHVFPLHHVLQMLALQASTQLRTRITLQQRPGRDLRTLPGALHYRVLTCPSRP